VDHVEKGQLIIVLDPHDYEVALENAEARLATAIRQAKTAKRRKFVLILLIACGELRE
jgi:multidrug resistance efflux pump